MLPCHSSSEMCCTAKIQCFCVFRLSKQIQTTKKQKNNKKIVRCILCYNCYYQISFKCHSPLFTFHLKTTMKKSIRAASVVLKMKQEEVTFFFIVSSPFATAKKAESVITWRSWKIITIWLEVNLRKVEECIAHFFHLIQKWFLDCSASWGDCILHLKGRRKQCT